MNRLRFTHRAAQQNLALDPREHAPAVGQGSVEDSQPVLPRQQVRQDQPAASVGRRRAFEGLPQKLAGGSRGHEHRTASRVDRSSGPGQPDECAAEGRESPGANEHACLFFHELGAEASASEPARTARLR
jgi:hypothetical protein